MTDRFLTGAAGVAALAGGLLRIANSFAGAWLGHRALEGVFFVEDLLLLTGLLGIYLSQRGTLGTVGLTGFMLGVLGLYTIRSASLFGAGGYTLGAAELLIGLSLIGIRLMAAGQRVVPLFFFASLALGLLSLLPALARPCALLAAICFGLGFALAGARLLRTSSR
jgi:hypothetical protein